VVSTSLPATRIIVALDGCDRLKGSEIDSSGDWASASCVGELQFACGGAITEVVDVGWGGTKVETIAELEPDVIFVSSGTDADALKDKIGAPVVVNMPPQTANMTMMEWWSQQIRCTGIVLGRDAEAEDLISFMEEKLGLVTDISSQIDDDEKPRVYYALGLLRRHNKAHRLLRPDRVGGGGIHEAKEEAIAPVSSRSRKQTSVGLGPRHNSYQMPSELTSIETHIHRDGALNPMFQDGGVMRRTRCSLLLMSTCRYFPPHP
jgi:hypothetical protein